MTATAPMFERYIGIDYSGAETPTSSLRGLRVYVADDHHRPREEPPPPGPRKYWTRRGLAEWLVAELSRVRATVCGIDHGFSLPLAYFHRHGLAHDWQAFLDDFQRHWPTDGDHVYVDFVRDGSVGNGSSRAGDTRWRRLTERRTGSAKSLFHFDVPGQVAKSTHAGLPQLRYLRRSAGPTLHFWPFDGLEIPRGRSAVVEVYPRLWRKEPTPVGWTSDQHDAFTVAEWLREADRDGRLNACLDPVLTPDEREAAEIEGWILGCGCPGPEPTDIANNK